LVASKQRAILTQTRQSGKEKNVTEGNEEREKDVRTKRKQISKSLTEGNKGNEEKKDVDMKTKVKIV
jgi:hypothetical protein